jgi:signal transduction histidine kinase
MSSGRWTLIAICLIASMLLPPVASSEPLGRGILIVDEFGPDSPFGRRFRQQIHSTLNTETTQRYVIHSEFLDAARYSGSEYDSILDTYFVSKYRKIRISVIVALGTEALKFVSRIRAGISPSAPIVFAIVGQNLMANSIVPTNATGIIEQRGFKYLIDSARLLVPNLTRIVLVGEPLDHQLFRHTYQHDLQQVAKDLKVINLTGLPLVDVQSRIAALPDDTAIVYLPMYTDKSGVIHNPAEALRAIANVANRPIVVDSETFIGIGAAGGFIPSAEDLGRETAQRVAHILNGGSAPTVPIEYKNFTKPIFDSRQLKRWHVSDAALPEGTELRFHELGVWDRYYSQILATAAVIAIQCLVIALLMYERRGRHIAERESRQHLLEVTKMDRAMTVSAMSASIAHELSQPLGAILNNTETAEILLSANPLDLDQLKEICVDIRRDDHRAVNIIKHLRALLKQSDLDVQDIDLAKAVNNFLALIRPQAAERGVVLQAGPIPANLWVRADPVHLQQVLLNLAMNAIDAMLDMPAGERTLSLQVSPQNSGVTISIADTGPGIPEDKLKTIFEPFVTTKQQGTGLGLSICRTIINTYGGAIWVVNGANGGAIFHFTLTSPQAATA